MSKWFLKYKFPVSFPLEPIDSLDPNFDAMFIRLTVYDELDQYLDNIEKQHGKFWISSPSGGFGKSTMLNYIARRLLRSISDIRTIPFHLYITQYTHLSIEHAFVRSFLSEFLKLDQTLKKASEVFQTKIPEEIEKTIIDEFEAFKSQIEQLQSALSRMNIEELTSKFYTLLDKVLLPWKEKGVVRKYVLLIDEMDKLGHEDVLGFLSANQRLFENLYNKYGFVAFLSGHMSWVERIRDGTEYSYYHGKIFRIPPLIDVKDVKHLVESRLYYYLYFNPADNPWKDEGYEKLLELSGGIPRRILWLASEVMNEAYQKKASAIGSGLVEETLVREKYVHEVEEYLRNNIKTYIKLRTAIARRADDLLYIYYDMPSHIIPKDYDRDITKRTRHLGVEIDDEEWWEKTFTLIKSECILDKGNFRELSADLVELFDKLSEHPALIRKVIPEIIRKIGEITPAKEIEIPPPDYAEIIDRSFKISPNRWLTEDDVFNIFYDSATIQAYFSHRKIKDFEKIVNIFKKEFKIYIEKNYNEIMIFHDPSNGKKYYRKKPKDLSREHYDEIAKLQCREFIDDYINFVVLPETFNQVLISKTDDLIEHCLKLLSKAKMIRFENGVLRTKKRHELFKKLNIPSETKKYIDFYLRESKSEVPNTQIIKETIKEIVISLIRSYEDLVKIPAEKNLDDYLKLQEIENMLRTCIESELNKLTDKWWKQRVPEDVRKNAEDRKKKKETVWPWYSGKEFPVTAYLDFTDYERIILRRDNWDEVFKDIFKDEIQIKASLHRLKPIRDAIAHHRPLNGDERMILDLEKKYVCGCIEKYYMDKERQKATSHV